MTETLDLGPMGVTSSGTNNEDVWLGSLGATPSDAVTIDKEVGTKHDQGKPRWSLLSMKFLEEMSRVLTYGAQKYASHNWRKGIEVSRSLDAAFRHLSAAAEGQDLDADPATKEWLLSNLAQAAINCMFAWETIRERPDFDDRYKGEKK